MSFLRPYYVIGFPEAWQAGMWLTYREYMSLPIKGHIGTHHFPRHSLPIVEAEPDRITGDT